jgi:hypothetical protein
MEIIVPWDDSLEGMAGQAAPYPQVRFLPLGTLTTEKPKLSPAGQHELFDRRRAAGLSAATGELVAILEDRSVPRRDWARRAASAHESAPYNVIGGAIENGLDRLLNWAVYYCDFGRYQLPFFPGPRSYVSDVNVCYKRAALDRTRTLWASGYHETTVHWAMRRAGEVLWLDPSMVVDQVREDLTLAGLLRERVAWGRLFAFTRARESSLGRRLLHSLVTPALPFLLYWRLLRDQLGKRVTVGRFVTATPAVFLLLVAWSLGELAGYLTGRA